MRGVAVALMCFLQEGHNLLGGWLRWTGELLLRRGAFGLQLLHFHDCGEMYLLMPVQLLCTITAH
jgi:hypothetical protein